VVLNTALVRVLFPAAAVGMALSAESQGWGLLNRYDVPVWVAVVAGIVLLDLAIYLQHVMFHAVPALWRLHRMHHADLDIDVTTGARFHPVEIALSMLIKFAAIAALGVPAAAVLLFEVLLNATSMFNHANVRIPLALEPVLRWLVATPDMHRVHHSIERDETNTATSASTCRSGTASSAPTAPSRARLAQPDSRSSGRLRHDDAMSTNRRHFGF
jgi:sterol desaturase/sphingolipid hydroxylase (fatty acid hydroxylase superfamily)